MSQENVELVKRATDAINRRDAEALLSELDPEVEWHSGILIAMGGKQVVSGTLATGWSQSAAFTAEPLEAAGLSE